MSRQFFTVLVFVCCVSGRIHAQSGPVVQKRSGTLFPISAPPAGAPAVQNVVNKDEIAEVLMRLGNPVTREDAIALAGTYPAVAIPVFWDFIDDSSKSPQARKDALAALSTIYQRARKAQTAKDVKALKAWNAGALEVYQKNYADPKWDVPLTKIFDDPADESEAALASLKAAVDAGCKDPRARLMYVTRSLECRRMGAEKGANELRRIAEDFEASDYSGGQKCIAYMVLVHAFCAEGAVEHSTEAERDSSMRRAIAHFPDVLKENPGSATVQKMLRQLRDVAVEESRTDGPTSVVTPFAHVEDMLKSAVPESSYRYAAKAQMHLVDASQYCIYCETSPEAAALHDQMHEACEKGWKADPLSPTCAALMVHYLMWVDGPKEVMELWFQRAALADPHSYEAYEAKGDFLSPQWEGKRSSTAKYTEEAFAFAKVCVSAGDGDDRISTVALRVFNRLAWGEGDIEAYNDKIWPDTRAACEKLLADKTRLQAHPASYLKDRSTYLRAACDFHRWPEAAVLMRDFGNDFDLEAFGGETLYDFCRQRAFRITPSADRRSERPATTRGNRGP